VDFAIRASTAAPPSGGTAAGRPANASTGLVHLYRAEVGRLTAFRQRLDTTTAWAITTIGLVTTFALGNASISHAAFLVLMFLVLFFVVLEGRRFRAYEASRIRVVLLERSFFPQLLDAAADPRWVDTLVGMLQQPTPTVSPRAAIAWRLRVNYLWLFGVILLVWVVKVDLTRGLTGPLDLVDQAAVGSLPGWLVLASVALGYALLFLVALTTRPTVAGADRQAELLLSQDRD
jgi:uncharacterized membrane protein